MDFLSYQPPELLLLGSVVHEIRAHDWRVRRLERNLGYADGAPVVRLTEVSRQFGVTPDHLGRVFKQQVGSNFREFAVKERLHHAAAKLLNSKRTVKEIAGEAGYQHASDFSRTFKRLFGLTPQEFRRRRTDGQEC